jgi:FKBP-type peptidyl-prolyl cis-trans isomerase
MRAKWMAVVGLGLLAAQVSARESRPPKTQKEKVSYAMGVAVAKNIQRQRLDTDVDVLARGLRDALSGRKLLMSEEELRAAMGAVTAELKQKAASARADRKAAGEAFRAENAKKEGVVTLPSGVQYKILTAGEGKTPGDGDTVLCHYQGSSIEGRVFDSSYQRGKPATVALARATPGWREVLKLMPVGSTWQVVIPPELGKTGGARGRKSKVRSNETLVFEIQLIAINPESAPDSAAEQTAAAPPRQETRKY